MDAGNFLNLVTNFSSLNAEELLAIQEHATQYPYSQLLHLLASRGAQDLKSGDQQAALHRAAVYATDRTVLKKVMTAPSRPRILPEAMKLAATIAVSPPPVAKRPEPPVQRVVEGPAPTNQIEYAAPGASNSLEGDALREDLQKELSKLNRLMHDFDESYERLKSHKPSKEPTHDPPAEDLAKSEAPLIEEIKTSRRKPKLVSPKVAEQGEIIDHFIKVVPTLPRTKPTEPTADLAEESVNYGDGIVSETLVEILLKQGKKAKAIEMLKKLIWKFPQKKAYFAAQIEALKS